MSAEETPKTDLLPSAESTSGISTAAGDASISSGTRDQQHPDPSPALEQGAKDLDATSKHMQELKAHILHDLDEVVLVCLRLCVGENSFL